ncbi:MAG: hypothetical protein Q7O66_10950 [Dehalococcoidia bacterium]|nr:hypothetical protein [Dehalococcoidia bacterium]
MSKIAELQKKYPNIPQEVIVKWDVLGSGVRDTEGLDRVSNWARDGGFGTYQSYDHDVSLQDLVKKNPLRAKQGYILTPGEFYMRHGTGVRIQRDTASPYEIKELDSGGFGLFEGSEKVDVDIFFVPPKPMPEEPRTSKGTLASTLLDVRRQNCFTIAPVRHCEYFNRGEQCKFCNYNATQEDARSVGGLRPAAITLEETTEAYKIVSSTVRFIEGRFQMGAISDSEQEAKVLLNFVENIAKGAPHKPVLNLVIQPANRKVLQRLKDAGLDCLSLCMEVWDPKLFPEVCPGKAKYRGRDRYLETGQDAVDVFGVGNVCCNFVPGVTLMPENGHKTWQEARDSHVEGNTWMIKNGVFPTFLNLRLTYGSVYGNDSSNREKLPPTDYYLDVAQAHHEAMLEYGLYPKLNKLMSCGFCCSPRVYNGDIGALQLAGDLGTWMADSVPPEQNWLAEFVSTVSVQKVEDTK